MSNQKHKNLLSYSDVVKPGYKSNIRQITNPLFFLQLQTTIFSKQISQYFSDEDILILKRYFTYENFLTFLNLNLKLKNVKHEEQNPAYELTKTVRELSEIYECLIADPLYSPYIYSPVHGLIVNYLQAICYYLKRSVWTENKH